jgi:hypothetical protein
VQKTRIRMARVTLTYEECTALRQAAERIPMQRRSQNLVSALRILCAVMAAVEGGRSMLDGEADTPIPERPSS